MNLTFAAQALKGNHPAFADMSLRLLTDLVDMAARSTYQDVDEAIEVPAGIVIAVIALDGRMRILLGEDGTPLHATEAHGRPLATLGAGDVYVPEAGVLDTDKLV